MKFENEIIQSSGSTPQASYDFAIPEASLSKIFKILVSGMYPNKVLAVLREYSCNAYDAHIEAGIPDRPIEIHLPTKFESSYIVRDFGPGLSEDSMATVFTQVGVSTKDASNDQVGAYGMGALCGYGYDGGGSFTVTSWYNGMKTVYLASPGEKMGILNKLVEVPCSPDETGVEVKIAVKEKDYDRFRQEAEALLMWMQPQPKINTTLRNPLDPANAQVFKSGALFKTQNRLQANWVGLMGCVPYTIDMDRVPLDESFRSQLRNVQGALFFPIGSVDIPPSREQLEYTDRTIEAVKKSIETLIEEATRTFQDRMEALEGNDIARRREAQRFQRTSNLPLGKWAPYTHANNIQTPSARTAGSFQVKAFDFREDVAGVRYYFTGYNVSGVSSEEQTFILDDTNKPISGYRELLEGFGGRRAYLVVPAVDYCEQRRLEAEARRDNKAAPKLPTPTPDEALASLNEWLKNNKLLGCKVLRLSNYTHTPYKNPKAVVNAKHKQTVFRWLGKNHTPKSSCWESVPEVPKGGQSIIISRFEPLEGEGFGEYHSSLYSLCRLRYDLKDAGITLPEIYGVKTTSKKPITREDLESGTLEEWVQAEIDKLIDPQEIATYGGPPAPLVDVYGNSQRPVLAKNLPSHLTYLMPKDSPSAAYRDIGALCQKHAEEQSKALEAQKIVPRKYLKGGALYKLVHRYGSAKQRQLLTLSSDNAPFNGYSLVKWHYPLVEDLGYSFSRFLNGSGDNSRYREYMEAMDALRVDQTPKMPAAIAAARYTNKP